MNYLNQINSGQIKLNNVESKINILITGDFCPINKANNFCSENDSHKIYGDLLDELESKDFSITNLESPLTHFNLKIPKSGPSIKAKPECNNILKAGHFDLVALANNHIMDYGEQGLIDTIENCKKEKIDTVGAGKNLDEATKIFYKKIKNITLAIINITEHEFSIAEFDKAGAAPLDIINTFYNINIAKNKADFVFVIIHGGNESYKFPSPRLKKKFRFFADAGASAVIGHHTHVASGIEVYNGKPLIYSLGNFIFDDSDTNNPDYFKSYFVKFALGKEKINSLKVYPYYQFYKTVGLKQMSSNEKSDFLKSIKNVSTIIENDKLLEKEWNCFLNDNKFSYLTKLLLLKPGFRFLFKRSNWFRKIILNQRKQDLLLNLFQCEAHHESLISILKNSSIKQQ